MKLTKPQARAIWLKSCGLHKRSPFKAGASAAQACIEQLGYVQIDTINVIERAHHHILYSRIPNYKKSDLHQLQTVDKTIFEYWAHALAFLPTQSFRFYIPEMLDMKKNRNRWFAQVSAAEMKKVLSLIKKSGAISIRDIKDDVLVEKEHEWASKKPSKRALQLGFYQGDLVIAERDGMLKKYELTKRHFNWSSLPKAATATEVLNYRLDKALRSQGLVDLNSTCHNRPSQKKKMQQLIEERIQTEDLTETSVEGKTYFVRPEDINLRIKIDTELVHILSPFDPLVIQRKKTEQIFDYKHIFEAYVAINKRIYGYFCLPVLVGDRFVALLDLKTDREKNRLLVQGWHWLQKSPECKKLIEQELHRFEKFQLHRG